MYKLHLCSWILNIFDYVQIDKMFSYGPAQH